MSKNDIGASFPSGDQSLLKLTSRNRCVTSTAVSTTATTTVTAPSPTATAFNATSNYLRPPPSTIATVDVNCPALNSQNIVTSGFNQKFSVYCDVNMANGNMGSNGFRIYDFVALYAFSFEDCLQACSGANSFFAGSCKAVSFRVDMAVIDIKLHSNCWLKNGTSQGTQEFGSVSAKLIE